MPIYEYQCGICETVYEELIRRDRIPPMIMCTNCGGLAGKLISLPSIKTSKKSPDKELGPAPLFEGYSELMLGE